MTSPLISFPMDLRFSIELLILSHSPFIRFEFLSLLIRIKMIYDYGVSILKTFKIIMGKVELKNI